MSFILEFIIDFILEVLVHPFLFVFYFTGIILLKAVNYDTNNIRKFNFFALAKEDNTEGLVSYYFPIKISLVFWFILAILVYLVSVVF